MTESSSHKDNRPPKPRPKSPRLNLPFTRQKSDAGTWVYYHRVGICITLAVYLLTAIVAVGARVIVKAPSHTDGIVLDLRTIEELREEKQRLEREVRLRQASSEGTLARNAISNESAELRDDRNTDMSQIRNRADNIDSKMNSNRDAWEQGLREIDAMHNEKEGDQNNETNNDSRAKGRVLVSFSLANPVRYGDNIITPGYRCERGGEVVVDITVNRSGNVVVAAVNKELSDSDNCMHGTALDAARRSRFNLDSSAPERQTGTITYLFIPQ